TTHEPQEHQFIDQDIAELAATYTTDPNAVQPGFGMSYTDAIAADKLFGATEGIDAILQGHLPNGKVLNPPVDAIVAPTDNPAWPTDLINGDHFVIGTSGPAAIVGYPILTVPM